MSDSKAKPRFLCRNQKCDKKNFQLEYELNAKYQGTSELRFFGAGYRVYFVEHNHHIVVLLYGG